MRSPMPGAIFVAASLAISACAPAVREGGVQAAQPEARAGTAAAPAGAPVGTRAAAQDTVWIIANPVRADRRQDFERAMQRLREAGTRVEEDGSLIAVQREGTVTRGLSEVAGRPYLPVPDLARALGGTERLGIDWLGPEEDFRVAPGSDFPEPRADWIAPQQVFVPAIVIRSERCGILCLQEPDLVRFDQRAASQHVAPVSGADDPNRSPNAPRTQGEQP